MQTTLKHITSVPPPAQQSNGQPVPYLITALEYLQCCIADRLATHLQQPVPEYPPLTLPHEEDPSSFARFIKQHRPGHNELLLLLIALAPHVVAGFFDGLIQQFLPQGGELPEFGGTRGQRHRGMLPTGETALFLLAGTNPQARLQLLPLFNKEQWLFRHHILSLETVSGGEPPLSGKLLIDPEFAEVFTTGKVGLPQLSTTFPAEHITTQMTWADLVLPENVWKQIQELQNWLKHGKTLMEEWGMAKKLKPGYKLLFYGPPGTGKTLTATLLGKHTGREVFRIDLSTVVSKYIGETEKNLSSLFDKAEDKNWILFFDEADAIFGKRTGVRDAHDKYANQEVSYLLQRIEMHAGLTILASNFRNNMDDAFIRRFNALIYFPPPQPAERYLLWTKAFPPAITLDEDTDLRSIADTYALTGSHIINVVQHICLNALEKGVYNISQEIIIQGIKRELEKEGK
ncbi:ATP-binding protein [Chitinophaga japonensis]|uniref:ATPase family protein associated with various cellular activities (AAA) n=1 Tax=Chitinophaga japonensis TaxID=104662 RepID=A0A562T2S1_CHIJA|nr:ATP-binding protein [Chitinophaga japonensis]TWI87030.1 ATPase family protein associated with various cellular activities (AAA) [Chitinophaga japonensis]